MDYLFCHLLFHECCKDQRAAAEAEAEARAVAGAVARAENAVTQRRGSIMMAEAKQRSLQCQQDNPETWPFKVIGEDSKKAVCWHHRAQICPFCCMDFIVINKLRENNAYLELLNKSGCEQERLSIVESTISEYYERIKRLSLSPPGIKHAPFMSSLEESLAQDNDHFRKISLAAYHCYDARSTSLSHARELTPEIDSVIQTMETLKMTSNRQSM